MFIRNLSRHLKEGMNVVIQMFGIEYSGKIISLDMGNPQDAGMILEDDSGTRHLIPINYNSCISFTIDEEEESEEEESYKTYDEMEIEELRGLCDDRKIKYNPNTKKRGIVNSLKYADEKKQERIDKRKGKKKSSSK